MSDEFTPDLQLEIAHLLLIDVVGYSKLLVNDQIELMQELNRIVRGSECFRAAEARDKLIRLPTGDGMALLFFENPEQPVRCALEISQALQSHPEIKVRMGIHSGPVNKITDVNDRSNVAGAGINVAQRVIDCGDAGHILLSKHLADDLENYRHWRPYLQDLGECEVKHGLRLHIFSLFKDGLGNPQVPEKLKRRRRWKQSSPPVRPITAARWPKWAPLAALLVAGGALVFSFVIFFHRPSLASLRTALEPAAFIAEKSIAVLPFENLSDEKQDAYFADGVQDEILTDLAKVADLKVISRTSVMQYKNSARRNLREIARALGVAHILEGTVQRAGGRVRVSAQLIDARTDAHLWAERYDRDSADVFAIENELSEKIVAQLKAQLSPQVKAAIEQKPTADLAAYDLYAHAKKLIERAVFNAPRTENLFKAVQLLDDAVKRDPNFFLAYCQLAHAHDMIYFLGADHTSTRLALADAAIQSALRLRPDAGEAHLALAKHRYWGYLDYDGARQELTVAQTALPNDPWPLLLTGYIERRQSRWDESTRAFEHAAELDPRNIIILKQISLSYECLRRYDDMARTLDRALKIAPKDIPTRLRRAFVDLDQRADLKPLRTTIHAILAEDPTNVGNVSEEWMLLALYERDRETATRALTALPPDGCSNESVPFPRAWCEGLVARHHGDTAGAREAFTRGRAELETILRGQPNYAEALSALGMMDAALGRTEEAIREGSRAVELLPVAKDSIGGALLVNNLAIIYAWTGKKDLAFAQMEIAARLPGYFSYGDVRLDPIWDPLRGDARFEKIVALLAPKA